jgi:pyruvate,water dikinase
VASGQLLIPLEAIGEDERAIVGGKAANLARLAKSGFTVPRGWCLTTRAYQAFVSQAGLVEPMRMELGRKPLDEMRWEEIWDAALRIRGLFLRRPLPARLSSVIGEVVQALGDSTSLAVRSSAVGEDSAGRSFAGLHESIVGARGKRAVEDAVKVVWASLWSDAALLYRRELGLDPALSRMAVVVQEVIDADRSGVAFARDPRDSDKCCAIVESVPGPCRLLVDGELDPDRWEIDRDTGRVVAWRPGCRDGGDGTPLLEPRDVAQVHSALMAIERSFAWEPDMEWTGRGEDFTVLQARPITHRSPDPDTERSWYLSLRPKDGRLSRLRDRVAEELIPQLERDGSALAAEDLEGLDEARLADSIDSRAEYLTLWKQIYWVEFIPFAHGVRRLATYYNDAVQPEDPYEFVGLLRDQPLLASERNRALERLARDVAEDGLLRSEIETLLEEPHDALDWETLRRRLPRVSPGARRFLGALDTLSESHLDIAYDKTRVHDRPATLLRTLLQLSRRSGTGSSSPSTPSPAQLEQRLFDAIGEDRRDEGEEILATGRISWKLRDDDNLLVARLESQLLRALELAADRLRADGRLFGNEVRTDHAEVLATALRDSSTTVTLAAPTAPAAVPPRPSGQTPRQMVGQPAAPGVSTGRVRLVRGSEDLAAFQEGEVLVCDAIQPTMTHLVPLSTAIVERRGGMLIHGAIIARELGIPCVNGVHDATALLDDGVLVTVDGHLGLVVVGEAEFDLELGS